MQKIQGVKRNLQRRGNYLVLEIRLMLRRLNIRLQWKKWIAWEMGSVKSRAKHKRKTDISEHKQRKKKRTRQLAVSSLVSE